MKINSNFKLFASANFDPGRYVESPAYGVARFMLDRIGDEKARATSIVKYEPDSKFPSHVHVGGEEFLVLEGTFRDEHGAYPKGTYVRNPVGSCHEPWVETDGCTILVKLLQMADITPEEETKPLYVDPYRLKEEATSTTGAQQSPEASAVELYSNQRTGERVQMCWIDANQNFVVVDDDEGARGGEELFVVEGSLVHVPVGQEDAREQEYGKWGWLRFPACESGATTTKGKIRAGNDGAVVYRKTGHLTERALSMEKIQIGPVNETVITA